MVRTLDLLEFVLIRQHALAIREVGQDILDEAARAQHKSSGGRRAEGFVDHEG